MEAMRMRGAVGLMLLGTIGACGSSDGDTGAGDTAVYSFFPPGQACPSVDAALPGDDEYGDVAATC
jgi:hypothetical protein